MGPDDRDVRQYDVVHTMIVTLNSDLPNDPHIWLLDFPVQNVKIAAFRESKFDQGCTTPWLWFIFFWHILKGMAGGGGGGGYFDLQGKIYILKVQIYSVLRLSTP